MIEGSSVSGGYPDNYDYDCLDDDFDDVDNDFDDPDLDDDDYDDDYY